VAELFLDDAVVVAGMREADRFAGGPELPLQGVAHLEAGRPVALRVEYWTGPALDAPPFHPTDVWGEELPVGHVPRLQLGWEPPGDAIERAARLAAESDVAVVVVGASSGEGADRTSLALPGDQDALVGAVARANPRTVVVLNTPGPVLMPWLPEVAAVLQAWYPGQQFGDALAAVLFGDDDPGGRLPVTFPATAGQGPITGPERYPGVDGVARYDEGLLVGYRWFDAHAQAPLFPFGHGLSYTSFAYGELRATLDAGAGLVRAVVEVANTGDRAGSEVVQLYVSAPPAAEGPPAVLAGFRKVRLEPGASTEVGFVLPVDALAVYGSAGGRRVLHPGRYGLAVGASSRDLRASAAVELGTA
jgi:beta-glucosidase